MINIIRMLTIDEGCKNKAYKDTKGNVTVGIGFNMDDVNAINLWKEAAINTDFSLTYLGNTTLPQNEIWDLLNVCVKHAKQDLLHLFSDFYSHPEFVQLVLINLMFNLGAYKFSQFHQFIGFVKVGNYDGAAEDIGNTELAKEEANRIRRLMALLKGDDSLYV